MAPKERSTFAGTAKQLADVLRCFANSDRWMKPAPRCEARAAKHSRLQKRVLMWTMLKSLQSNLAFEKTKVVQACRMVEKGSSWADELSPRHAEQMASNLLGDLKVLKEALSKNAEAGWLKPCFGKAPLTMSSFSSASTSSGSKVWAAGAIASVPDTADVAAGEDEKQAEEEVPEKDALVEPEELAFELSAEVKRVEQMEKEVEASLFPGVEAVQVEAARRRAEVRDLSKELHAELNGPSSGQSKKEAAGKRSRVGEAFNTGKKNRTGGSGKTVITANGQKVTIRGKADRMVGGLWQILVDGSSKCCIYKYHFGEGNTLASLKIMRQCAEALIRGDVAVENLKKHRDLILAGLAPPASEPSSSSSAIVPSTSTAQIASSSVAIVPSSIDALFALLPFLSIDFDA